MFVHKHLCEKAEEALRDKNYDLVIEILKNHILPIYPDNVEVRKLLRGAELEKLKNSGRSSQGRIILMRLIYKIKISIFKLLKKWEAVMQTAEDYLVGDPRNIKALYVLGEAAVKKGYTDTAIYVLKSLIETDSMHIAALKLMGRLYKDNGDLEKSQCYFQKANRLNPMDDEASREIKALAASRTAKCYGKARSSRELIQDRETYRELDLDTSHLHTDKEKREIVDSALVSPKLHRKSTIRYFKQMHPTLTFPMVVLFSQKRIKEVVHKKLAQVEGAKELVVERDKPLVEVTPRCPGCLVVPPKYTLDITPELTQAYFDVTPLGEGIFSKACVEIRHNDRLIDTVNIPYRVEKQTIAKLAFYMGIISPIVSTLLDTLQIDFKKNLPLVVVWLTKIANTFGGASGFGIFLTFFFLICALFFYFLKRPKQADPIESMFSVGEEPDQNPMDRKTLRNFGYLYQKQEDYDKAIECYQKVLATDPTSFEIKTRIGECRIAKLDLEIRNLKENAHGETKKQFEKLQHQKLQVEIEEYTALVNEQPTNYVLQYKLGCAFFQNKNYQEAIPYFQHAVKDPLYRVDSLNFMGQAFMYQGQTDLAVKEYEKALSFLSAESEKYACILYNLGDAQEKNGEKEKAIETFNKIYEIDINYKDVAGRLERLRSG